ncbi:histidinol-phosphatase [Roseospirillum parvum]|uniref:Histidinol-phosphatase n=1 Tax=Roseospirillum parvum TaxID=83401 RepID=A0A1G7X0M6_9PROT|nr:histidinol-phosphatase [Roseospirillum parvum]SDG77734.1 myo-inositol-1(or 4)-monophosphatase [Roseospirillum parvum]
MSLILDRPDFEAGRDALALLAFAESLADAARPVVYRHFRQPLEVETKADLSPVTVADREIEAQMRALVRGSHPDHGILGEEAGTEGLERDLVWVLDPIDGTKSFISGMPTFGTLIGLAERGRPLAGVIDMPALNERWSAIKGRRTTVNGTPVAVSGQGELAQARLFSTAPEMFGKPDLKQRYDDLAGRVGLRRFGADCYGYCLLAGGWIDLVVEADLKPYDYMAVAPVVEHAGGVISDWNGQPLTLNSDGRVVAAASRQLHARAVALLKDR